MRSIGSHSAPPLSPPSVPSPPLSLTPTFIIEERESQYSYVTCPKSHRPEIRSLVLDFLLRVPIRVCRGAEWP